ncbi:MAG TPA: hypothetical protein VFP84_31615 [Kofleriaceae bacterium]|nr:hypothetical protein [Kofleriaceae bacterium]
MHPSRAAIALAIACIVGLARPAAADPPPRHETYDAFDLANGEIYVDELDAAAMVEPKSIEVIAGPSPRLCDANFTDPVGDSGNVKLRVFDIRKQCPLFSPAPPAFAAQFALSGSSVKHTTNVDFDEGAAFSGRVSYEGQSLHIWDVHQALALNVFSRDACFAYYSVKDARWQATQLAPNGQHDFVVTIPGLAPSGTIYVIQGACPPKAARPARSQVLQLNYVSIVVSDLGGDSFCDANQADYKRIYSNDDNYEVCIDQANSLNHARIVRNASHYIQTFSWGRLTVRHWRNVVPVVSIAGSGVSIAPPSFAGAVSAPGPASAAPSVASAPGPASSAPAAASAPGGFSPPATQDGQGASGDTKGDSLISTFFIPPHRPGALHLDVKFLDPVDAKPKSETAVDLDVDQGYAGAIRVGLGHVFHAAGPADHTYSKIRRAKNLPAEITQGSANDGELVIGYSVFGETAFAGGSPAGRTYAIRDQGAGAFLKHHLGLYVGVGLLEFNTSTLKFLKSVHLGLDIEISRNISIVSSLALRRATTLGGGLSPGGPAPDGDIPTTNRLELGWGLTLNFSTDFISFVEAQRTK